MGKLRETWRHLRESDPGRRFQDYHGRRRQEASPTGRALTIALGVLLSLVGGFLLMVPGPGIPILAVGAALLAREWRWAARLLDGAELKIRQLISWALRIWGRSPAWARALLALGALAVAGGVSLGAYEIVFGR